MADDSCSAGTELECLLKRNAMGAISVDDMLRARELIYNGSLGQDDCVLCLASNPKDVTKAIIGIPYCADHADFALMAGIYDAGKTGDDGGTRLERKTDCH